MPRKSSRTSRANGAARRGKRLTRGAPRTTKSAKRALAARGAPLRKSKTGARKKSGQENRRKKSGGFLSNLFT